MVMCYGMKINESWFTSLVKSRCGFFGYFSFRSFVKNEEIWQKWTLDISFGKKMNSELKFGPKNESFEWKWALDSNFDKKWALNASFDKKINTE